MTIEHHPIFVYGTLQRGAERESMWPCKPVSIEWATTRGRLHDLGPYPALTDGSDLIRGELWHIASKEMQVTLDVLDEIECYGKEDVDLYVRRVVSARADNGRLVDAYTYLFATPYDLANYPVVRSSEDGVCHWHRFLP